MPRLFCGLLLLLAAPVHADEDIGAPFGMLPLVDEVVTGNAADPHTLFEDPVGGSQISTVLGKSARTMTMDTNAKIFGYKIGAGKGLVAGQAYVLVVEYPEEAGRQLVVVNRGAEQVRTYATGQTIGDARESYTYPAPESLKYPLSGKWESIRSFFYLHEHFQGVKAARDSSAIVMDGTPADGFWVIIGQFRKKDSPFDAGAAVARIRLFSVPDPSKLDVAIHFPPSDLPRRHISWREEMADGIIGSSDPAKRAFAKSADWYDAKMKLARFLGVNTFTKDLLEFGYNQNWDTTPGGGNAWMNAGPEPMLWEQILNLAAKHNMDVLPYYEYAGAKGGGTASVKSYGYQRHCRPLGDRPNDAFSDVGWSEDACIDVSDPAALDDVKKVLDATILRFKATVPFVGAWFRTRSTNWPISFADETLARYGAANGNVTPTRAQLQTDSALLAKYYTWWFGQRRAYLIAIRDYLRQNGLPDSAVLFTSYIEEALHVPTLADWAVPTDDMTAVGQVNMNDPWKWRFPPTDWMPYVTAQKYTEMIQRMTPLTSAQLAAHAAENDHSAPPADPKSYVDVDDVYMAMPFSRQFTVSSAAQFDQFRAKSGLAIVRHFTLNEEDGQNAAASDGPMSKKLGYFITDVDRAGAYSMLAEARAVAYGDPRFINYLSSSDFSRGFPEYTRAFNAAYLALPALPSTVVASAANDAEVIVRETKTAHGTFYAVVNIGLGSKADIKLTLPATGQVYDLSTGNVLDRASGLAFYPGQLYALEVSDTPIGLGDDDPSMPGTNQPKSPGGCACNVSSTAPNLGSMLMLALVALRLRRRR